MTVGLIGFFFCLLFSPVFPWGMSGHNIVAQLGQNMLTPEATEMVNSLLEPGQTLVSVANWPDQYRSTDEGTWTGCLHYVNVEMENRWFLFQRDCQDVGEISTCCAVAAILNYTLQVDEEVNGNEPRVKRDWQNSWENAKYQLNQGKATWGNKTNVKEREGWEKEKEEWNKEKIRFGLKYLFTGDDLEGEPTPLSFMVHFVGDLHQPLHAGYSCDAGGNSVEVLFEHEIRNFHSVWDSAMIEKYCGDDWMSLADELQNRINTSEWLRPTFSHSMNASLWAEESYNEYIRHKVYDFSEEGVDSNTGDPVVYPFNECPIPHVVDIPGSYYTRNIEVIKLRLMAGGIRLAQALNDIAAS